MIDWLRTAKSAHFQAKAKRLPKKAVVDLFRTIRQNSEAPSNNIFLHVKEPLGHASWSALAFLYERDPAFLDSPDGDVKERVCGFLLLVEHRDYVALFKSNLDVPSEFKTEYFQRIGIDRMEAAIARADATFEQIRLRNMATSKHAFRNKTLEANDLQSVVGPAGGNVTYREVIASAEVGITTLRLLILERFLCAPTGQVTENLFSGLCLSSIC